MDQLEEFLQDQSHYTQMCNICVRVGGLSKKDMVSNLLTRFMSKDLMCKYNMLGQRGKVPFGKTKLYSLIEQSILRKFSDSDSAEIFKLVATKLRNAPKLKPDEI